jgi:hypothetical protein
LHVASIGWQNTSTLATTTLTLQAPVTIPVAFVRGMLAGVQARGEPFESFLEAAGIPSELLEQARARVTSAHFIALSAC